MGECSGRHSDGVEAGRPELRVVGDLDPLDLDGGVAGAHRPARRLERQWSATPPAGAVPPRDGTAHRLAATGRAPHTSGMSSRRVRRRS